MSSYCSAIIQLFVAIAASKDKNNPLFLFRGSPLWATSMGYFVGYRRCSIHTHVEGRGLGAYIPTFHVLRFPGLHSLRMPSKAMRNVEEPGAARAALNTKLLRPVELNSNFLPQLSTHATHATHANGQSAHSTVCPPQLPACCSSSSSACCSSSTSASSSYATSF